MNPREPYDFRPVIGVLTKDQKKVLIGDFQAILENDLCPLTENQTAHIIALGPGSTEKSWMEIFTSEQKDCFIKCHLGNDK